MENQRIKNILADSLNLTEIKGKKSFLKILQTVKTFLLLQNWERIFKASIFVRGISNTAFAHQFFFFVWAKKL